MKTRQFGFVLAFVIFFLLTWLGSWINDGRYVTPWAIAGVVLGIGTLVTIRYVRGK